MTLNTTGTTIPVTANIRATIINRTPNNILTFLIIIDLYSLTCNIDKGYAHRRNLTFLVGDVSIQNIQGHF